MKTKRQAGHGDETPAIKLPRATRRAVRAAVRSQLPRHRRILVHPVTVLVLLCAGVFIVGLTYKTLAASVTATARVAAPALTEGAVITAPTEGQTFSAVPITVDGTCPANSYVKLYRNSAFSGSAWCSSGSFTIETTLSDGINTLQAQDYNVTDSPGPATNPINVTYVPPAPPPTDVSSTTIPSTGIASANSGAASQNTTPPLLSSDYSFHAFSAGSNFSWQLEILGGLPPYNVKTNWGDGTTTSVSIATRQKFTISHKYQSVGYFPVKIRVIDALGTKTILQLAALIKKSGTVGFAAKQPPDASQSMLNSGFVQQFSRWLWLIWPSYGIVTLMVFSFWLGEHQEILKLAQIHYSRSVKRHP